jgi:uncharacterized protein YcnI
VRGGDLRRAVAGLTAACAALAVFAGTASAHVLIRPDRAPPHRLELFTVLSPDERSVALTGLRLAIPQSLVVSSIGDTAGYTAQIVRDQDFRTVALSWQGGHTPPAHLALFHFAALTPTQTGAVTLTGVQTFADGSTRIWRSARLVVADAGGGAQGGDDDRAILAAAAVGILVGAAGLGLGAAALRRVWAR